MSVRSNEENPSVPEPVRGLPFVLDPESLPGLLEFEVTGRSTVAGRSTISARATRLPPIPDRPTMTLYPLGSGADHYEMQIDSERGVLLGVTAVYNGEVIQTNTAESIEFDSTIPVEMFTFEPADGEEIGPLRRSRPSE